MYVCMCIYRSLQALAQSIKGLSNMIPTPKSRDGTSGDNSARIWAILNEIRPDSLVLDQRLHSLTKGCWICVGISTLGGSNLLNEEGAAPALREGRGRRRKKAVRLPPKLERGRSRAKRVELKARRAWARGRSRGRSPNRIIIRTPPIILDTRLHDTHNKGTYQCDECEQLYYGPFQGEFIEGTRDLTYDDIVSGWQNGTVDASWFCVDCWQEKLGTDSNADMREVIGLPAASRDQQRSQTTDSTSIPHGGASVTIARRTVPAGPETTFRAASSMPPTTPQQGRRDLGEDASPRSTSERTCGGMEHGTPDTSAERALFGSGASRFTRLTNGWRSTVQGRRGQPATIPALAVEQFVVGMAWALTQAVGQMDIGPAEFAQDAQEQHHAETLPTLSFLIGASDADLYR